MLNKFHFSILLTLLISIVILSSCATAPLPQESSKSSSELPLWVTNPQNDTKNFIYGVALSRDRESAIKEALLNMVSKLGISIQSSYESNQEVGKYYDKSVSKNKIKSDIARIRVNNYEIVQSMRISYKEFAVMIKTDKKKFFDGLIEELKANKKSIELRLASLKGENILTRYNIKQELSLEVNRLKSSIFIAYELDKSFDKNEYLDFVLKIEQEFLNEKKNLSFYVYGDTKSTSFVNKIKNYLTQKGFKLANTHKRKSIQVKINTVENMIAENTINIAVLKVTIDVYDNTQKIGGKDIIMKERYNGSSSSIYKNASIHLEQDIESLGLNGAIGIKINSEN